MCKMRVKFAQSDAFARDMVFQMNFWAMKKESRDMSANYIKLKCRACLTEKPDKQAIRRFLDEYAYTA